MTKLESAINSYRGIGFAEDEDIDLMLSFVRRELDNGKTITSNKRVGETIELFAACDAEQDGIDVYHELCKLWNDLQPIYVADPRWVQPTAR